MFLLPPLPSCCILLPRLSPVFDTHKSDPFYLEHILMTYSTVWVLGERIQPDDMPDRLARKTLRLGKHCHPMSPFPCCHLVLHYPERRHYVSPNGREHSPHRIHHPLRRRALRSAVRSHHRRDTIWGLQSLLELAPELRRLRCSPIHDMGLKHRYKHRQRRLHLLRIPTLRTGLPILIFRLALEGLWIRRRWMQ
jgi:hypothetical protein